MSLEIIHLNVKKKKIAWAYPSQFLLMACIHRNGSHNVIKDKIKYCVLLKPETFLLENTKKKQVYIVRNFNYYVDQHIKKIFNKRTLFCYLIDLFEILQVTID